MYPLTGRKNKKKSKLNFNDKLRQQALTLGGFKSVPEKDLENVEEEAEGEMEEALESLSLFA